MCSKYRITKYIVNWALVLSVTGSSYALDDKNQELSGSAKTTSAKPHWIETQKCLPQPKTKLFQKPSNFNTLGMNIDQITKYKILN